MKITICFLASIAAAILTVAAVLKAKRNKCGTAMAGSIIALTFLFFPAGMGEEPIGFVNDMLAAVFRAVRVLFLGEDYSMEIFSFSSVPIWFENVYILWLSLLYIAAPILTFGAIISFLGSLSEYSRILMKLRKSIVVFSSSDEEAVNIAKNISGKNTFFIFCSASEKDMLSDELKRGSYAALSGDILSIDKLILSRSSRLSVYFNTDNEEKNLSDSLAIIKRLGVERSPKYHKADVLVFTENHAHELILNAIPKTNVELRRINRSTLLAERLISVDKDISAAYKACLEGKAVSISFIGFTGFIEELFKCLIWYLQSRSDAQVLQLNVYTDEKNIEDIKSKYPEIADTADLKDMVSYSVKLKTDYDPSEDNCSVMFIDKGSDTENINAAVSVYERTAKISSRNIVIKTPVRSLSIVSAGDETVLQPINHKKQVYPIEFIPYSIIHSINNKTYSDIEHIAEELFASWSDSGSSMYDFDFDYRSSMSSAFFWYMYVRNCLAKGEALEENEENMRLEHKRWNAFMRTEGYAYSSDRNDAAKLHNCLDSWDALEEKVKKYDGYTISAINKLMLNNTEK